MTTLNGTQVNSLRLHRPKYGCWRADVVLTEGATEPTGAVTLVCGTLTLAGKVLRSGLDAADRPHAVVVGGLGWQSLLTTPLSFQSDGGVQSRTVLNALAGHAAEALELPPSITIGEYYECLASRPSEPVRLADALDNLVQGGYCPNWRVDPDGITRFGPRTVATVTARATLIGPQNRALGLLTYGLDDPAQFAPENILDGNTIERVDIREEAGKLEADVWIVEPTSTSKTNRTTPNLREMVRRMLATELDDRIRTYIVVTQHADGRCDLSPPPDAPHLPELRNVEQWIIHGGNCVVAAGDECTVEFRDARKTRSVITGFRRKVGSTAADFPNAARVGDLVQSGGIGCMVAFSSIAGTPVAMGQPAGPTFVPVPGPYYISFGNGPTGPTPPVPMVDAAPLYGTISAGSEIFGIKAQP